MAPDYKKLSDIIKNFDRESLRNVAQDLHTINQSDAPRLEKKSDNLKLLFDCFPKNHHDYPGSYIGTLLNAEIVFRFRNREI